MCPRGQGRPRGLHLWYSFVIGRADEGRLCERHHGENHPLWRLCKMTRFNAVNRLGSTTYDITKSGRF